MLALTDSALDAVRQVLAKITDEGTGLRIAVQTGGCSGYRYSLAIDSAVQDGDEVIEFPGVTVFIDADSWSLLDGAEVDFVESVSGAGFVFNNPNAKSSCGCGKSFC
jgi:iron-sulfur cluster assembly protein